VDEFLEDNVTIGDPQPILEDSDDGIVEPEKDLLKIFSCRHVFHIRCLKKHFKRVGSESFDSFYKKMDKMRCPTCYLKDMEIDTETKGRARNVRIVP
jgi:hypothetical protein